MGNTTSRNNATPKGENFEAIHWAICESKLGYLLPKPINKIIVELSGVLPLYWSLVGDGVEISNKGYTIRQTVSSKSVIGNKIFKSNTG